jgi:hypothetical protein
MRASPVSRAGARARSARTRPRRPRRRASRARTGARQSHARTRVRMRYMPVCRGEHAMLAIVLLCLCCLCSTAFSAAHQTTHSQGLLGPGAFPAGYNGKAKTPP